MADDKIKSMNAMSDQEMLDQAQIVGIQLAQFIVLWDAPFEIKKALIWSVGLMTIEQQLELLEAFETAYYAERTKFIADDMQEKLENALTKHETRKEYLVGKLASFLKSSVDKMKFGVLKMKMGS